MNDRVDHPLAPRGFRTWDEVHERYEAHRVLMDAFRYSDSQPSEAMLHDFMENSFDMIRWAVFTYRNCKQGVAGRGLGGQNQTPPQGDLFHPDDPSGILYTEHSDG